MLPGLAHVATCSFLAARLAPSGQFWLALAGGVALARAGAERGLRAGYGASAAAVVETVALIGPARVNGPLTQALNAPLVGRMNARGAGFGAQLLACLAIRLAHYALLNVLFVWLVIGGLDNFVDTYDRIADFLRVLPEGQTAALVLTILGNLALALFYSSVQVLAYRRALRRWPAGEEPAGELDVHTRPPQPTRGAVAVAVVAIAGWVVLLGWLAWTVLGAVAAVLVLGILALGRSRLDALRLGVVLALVLGLGALFPAAVGATPFDEAAQRAVRAALLVLVAAWARAAAGTDGVRSLFGVLLWWLRALPAAREAAALTVVLRSDTRLRAAGSDLIERLRPVEKEILPVADALTEWVAAEARK